MDKEKNIAKDNDYWKNIALALCLELSDPQNIMSKILRNLQGGVILCDSLGQIIFVNDYLYEKNYLTSSFVSLQQTIDDLTFNNLADPKEMQTVRNGVKQAFQTGEIVFCDLQCFRDKQYVKSSAHIYPIYDSQHSIRFVLIFIVELSSTKQLDDGVSEQNEMLHQAGVMAVGVIHEAKNPLQSISSMAQLMRAKYSDLDDVVEYSNVIVEQVDNIAVLLSEFLGVVSFQYHNKELVDINELCGKIAFLLRSNSRMRGVEINESYDEKLPCILSNVSRMRQILINLLVNALDATSAGGHITLKTVFDQDANYAHISVIDDGCGMDEQTLANYSKPFYTTKKNGTGMGMKLCCDMVQEMGGILQVESQLNVGTTVTVTLPL